MARLENLPFNEENFIALMAALAIGAEDGETARRVVDHFCANHLSTPECVETVILSRDVMSRVMAQLLVRDFAVAAVCSVWRHAWRDSRGERRVLHVARTKEGRCC